MGKISILSQVVADKIAAGEVVERPASVVKELVENSLDAEATSINIDVEEAGRKSIRVSDDGLGMGREDARLSVQRHATSKISTEADLFRISSLGFRGEALASIASVSRFELVTCERGAVGGVRIKISGGNVGKVEDAPSAPGTAVTVNDLFYNTPARLKFLKRPSTELNHITEFVIRIALSHPQVRFSLTHNRGEIFTLGRASDMSARIMDTLGSGAAEAMREISYSSSNASVKGWAASSTLTKPSSNAFYTYVNGRFIRDRTVNHAILEGYNTITPKGRYPLCVIFIEVDPENVDVNVHPTKAEVRFKNASSIHEAVRRAIREAFQEGPPTAAVYHSPERRPQHTEASAKQDVKRALNSYIERNPATQADAQAYHKPLDGKAGPERIEQDSFPSESIESAPKPEQGEIGITGGHFGSMRPIGQVKSTYILCESGEGLILIDQHAAHERTVFDRLKKEINARKVQVQLMLLPETLELTASETGQMEKHIEAIKSLGFDLEPFGRNAFVVRGVPAILTGANVRDMVMDVLDGFSSSESGTAGLDDRIDDVLARLACHAVVRANREMSMSEIKALLDSLDRTDMPHTCPHGRPISAKVTIEEIEKMFHRR